METQTLPEEKKRVGLLLSQCVDNCERPTERLMSKQREFSFEIEFKRESILINNDNKSRVIVTIHLNICASFVNEVK